MRRVICQLHSPLLATAAAVLLLAPGGPTLAQTGGLTAGGTSPRPEVGPSEASPDAAGEGSMGITFGPDVTVMALETIDNYGAEGGIRAYAVGTDSCNVGSEPVWWCDDPGIPGCETNDHPVIAQNLYRLKEGRFEQLGMSWLKHGFVSTNSFDPDCVGNDGNGNPVTCLPPPQGGDQLGVGCTDFYSADLNGSQPLGRRSEVDATTGEYPFPPSGGGQTGTIGQRIQVAEADLDPAMNPGARYWLEGHYVAPDDAVEPNGLNNASHREVTVSGGSFDLDFSGPTVRELPAIFAWQAIDPEVEIVNVDVETDVPAEGGTTVVERFHAARRVTDNGGSWHYEFAIHNLNSNRSGQAFTVQFPGAANITNVGFRDVDHHSGEPFSTADWTPTLGADSITWATDPESVDPDANALRWSTMFSFWFDADAPPEGAAHTLDLFKAGTPTSVPIPFAGGATTIFEDGFESGDASAWDESTG